MTTNSFKGKKAIIIGGSSGIGKATAKQLLISGATVCIASRDQNSLDSAINELRKYGNVLSLQTDITDTTQVQDFLLKMNKEFSNVSFLVRKFQATTIEGESRFISVYGK